MKKVLLAGFISSTLVVSSFAAAFADDTVQGTTTSTSGTATVTAPASTGTDTTQTTAASTTTAAASTTTAAPTTVTAPAPTTAGTSTQTNTTKAGLIQQLKDAIDKALVKDVDPQVVSSLLAKNYSYSKIALIAELSKTSGKTVDEVSKVLDQKKGLGEIAQLLGIKVNDLQSIRKEISQRIASGMKDFRVAVKQDEQSIKDKIASLKGDVKKDKQDKKDVKDQVKKDAEAAVVKGIDPQVVDALRSKGYGYGQIALINAMAQKSGKTIDEVVTLLSQDKGIGETAKALGINPQDLKGIQKDINGQRKDAVEQDKGKVQDANTQLKDDQKELNQSKNELKKVQEHGKSAVKQFQKGHGRDQQKAQDNEQENEQD